MSDVWLDCLGRLPELENLRSIALVFDRHGGNDGSFDYEEDLLQTRFSRAAWREFLFELEGLNLQELAIRHNQDFPSREELSQRRHTSSTLLSSLEKEEALRNRILGGLHSLRLSFVHEQIRGESGSTLKVLHPMNIRTAKLTNSQTNDSHLCFANLPSTWLQPATQHLKHLTLYSDTPFGFFPKLDLRNIRLSNLRTLALGQYIISHDWQIDWIVSHSTTLHELYLDHCSILYQIGHADPDWLDEEGYPKHNNNNSSLYFERDDDDAYNQMSFISYPTRWHDIFRRFADSLPHLRAFRFGSSAQWNFDTENRFDDAGPGLPVVPWEAETEIKNEIFRERYLHYDDWNEEYNVKWGEGEWNNIDMEDKRWTTGMEEPPDCDEEDERVLKALLRSLKT